MKIFPVLLSVCITTAAKAQIKPVQSTPLQLTTEQKTSAKVFLQKRSSLKKINFPAFESNKASAFNKAIKFGQIGLPSQVKPLDNNTPVTSWSLGELQDGNLKFTDGPCDLQFQFATTDLSNGSGVDLTGVENGQLSPSAAIKIANATLGDHYLLEFHLTSLSDNNIITVANYFSTNPVSTTSSVPQYSTTSMILALTITDPTTIVVLNGIHTWRFLIAK